ncbi:uncharacterized protein FFB20_03998 [Fusarium fujikuroi]|nr:uncharacterized protein FFB20_03998 [Fusarium fujikuroi]SCN89212.1 uncharacterized protein FFE2_06656 [Fusarium fujikuroi]SCN99603.1 uncharacterized protein FFM5_07234 [Fusarium fujikuroi]SCO17983.1 uncharacterized protein FFC1_13110 [Fusarium fujikuroi]SCO38202.1 uncharacterized protein FFMR_04988 [Fusarium fujikuroi]
MAATYLTQSLFEVVLTSNLDWKEPSYEASSTPTMASAD